MRYDALCSRLESELRIDESFDIIKRPLTIGGYRAAMYMIDGFVKDEVMEKVMEFMMSAAKKDVDTLITPREFADRYISYVETDITADTQKAVTAVLSGTLALVLERYARVFLIDVRTYPSRGVEEPDDERVLRGSHDGFTETLIMNTALLRRRIRDPRLTVSAFSVGSESHTDIALVYMKGTADEKVIARLRKLIENIRVDSLSMAQQSLNSALNSKNGYNPFPKTRYTERPDAAAASVMEGDIVLMVDNSPSVMILPTSFFDFVQEANDFYFPPVVATYLRTIRVLMFLATVFIVPVWFLLVKEPQRIPEWLSFLKIAEPAKISLTAQILIFEFTMDGLKLASLNTPGSLSNSFSVVGALILGEFAVTSGLFSPQSVLYLAFAAISNFTQPSFELGYAFKLVRIMLVVLTALFDIWGFIAGVVIFAALLAFNRTAAGTSYLYPLIPFDGKALRSLFIIRKRAK